LAASAIAMRSRLPAAIKQRAEHAARIRGGLIRDLKIQID
jgi:hypothetical protein